MLARVLAVIVCLCLSVTRRYCIKTVKRRNTQTTPVQGLMPTVIGGRPPFHPKFALNVTHSFRKRRFWQISLNSVSAVRAGKKSSIIANSKWTMRFPSSHSWTLCVTPKSPEGSLKTRIFTFGFAFHIFIACNRRLQLQLSAKIGLLVRSTLWPLFRPLCYELEKFRPT